MTTQMITIKLTDRSAIAACPLGVLLPATGLSASLLPVPALPIRMRSERATEAPAVATSVKAQAHAYAFTAATNGAGAGNANGAEGAQVKTTGQQKTQQYGKWAFRGLEPWSDPA